MESDRKEKILKAVIEFKKSNETCDIIASLNELEKAIKEGGPGAATLAKEMYLKVNSNK